MPMMLERMNDKGRPSSVVDLTRGNRGPRKTKIGKSDCSGGEGSSSRFTFTLFSNKM